MITKSEIEAFENTCNALHETYAKACDQLRSLKDQYAEQECPFSVGEIVKVQGYSHRGKSMKITKILAPLHSFEGAWRVVGFVVKKDGTPGKVEATFSESDHKKGSKQ